MEITMIHPSYQELMEKLNEGSDLEDAPAVTSRYSVVLAASKRARQLTNGAEPKVQLDADKQLSVAIEEIYEGKITILSSPSDADPAADHAGSDDPSGMTGTGENGDFDETAAGEWNDYGDERSGKGDAAEETDGSIEDHEAGEPENSAASEDADDDEAAAFEDTAGAETFSGDAAAAETAAGDAADFEDASGAAPTSETAAGES